MAKNKCANRASKLISLSDSYIKSHERTLISAYDICA